MTILINCFNVLIKGLGALVSAVFYILPYSPFRLLEDPVVEKYLGYINYFVPVSAMILILEVWLTGVGIYLISQVVLRWAKVIE